MSKTLFPTRRYIMDGCRMEFIFTYKAGIQYLLEGRIAISPHSAWEYSELRGYLKSDHTNTFVTNYGDGTCVLTDLSTGEEVGSAINGRTYKLVIPNAFSTDGENKFINNIGLRVDNAYPWLGIIHSIKITNLKCGYNNESAPSHGKNAGLFLQFDRILDKTIEIDVSHTNADFVDSEDNIEETILGDPVNTDDGWEYNELENSWTRMDIAGWNNRLHIMPIEDGEMGQKNYERVLKVSFDAIIPEGKFMGIIYKRPNGTNTTSWCTNGKNEHYIYIQNANKNNDRERPYFDDDEGQGCVISNLVVTEYHGVVFNNLSWTKTNA